MFQQTYDVVGMSCAGCVKMVQNTVESIPEVARTLVSYDPPTLAVESESKIDSQRINEYLSEIGNFSVQESLTFDIIIQ